MFFVDDKILQEEKLKHQLLNPSSGAHVIFEGIVRDHHQGRKVQSLTYEAHRETAQQEGDKIVKEAADIYEIKHCIAAHRIGELAIGDCAVWVGVSAAHRDATFLAARYIIEELKLRLPIWKKEFYPDGTYDWINCQTKINKAF
jgi:molybdopterin synthase catalytic subunit